ncbi:hypothetical protein EDC01DRAFT_619240 [Geopyxis carbonaria]|nr:hypothetical protein EDC01DRAFT_619240 [Geopyxis carbonaria]
MTDLQPPPPQSPPAIPSPAPKQSRPAPSPSPRRRLLILTLRHLVSAKEYSALRRRGPRAVKSLVPTRGEFEAVANAPDLDDYFPAATRAGVRMLVLGNVVLNVWDLVTVRRKRQRARVSVGAFLRVVMDRSNFLSSLSLAVLIVVHRVLYRFFHQLRANLSLPQAKTFRVKYPRASRLFLAPSAPALAASVSGLALAIHPKIERRVTIAAYALVKAMEFYYNRLEDKGYFQNRPWWFGSWLLFPLTSGQLLYTFIFDRDCFPPEYGSFITKYSQEYLQARPASLPVSQPWPGPHTVLDSLSKIATLRYPPFTSPILFPDARALPASLAAITPVVAPAHPSITSLQCALLHPAEPSCLKTYIHFWASELPRIIKFLAAVYSLAYLPRYRRVLSHPFTTLQKLLQATGRTSLFITGALGSAWAANCLFQKLLPRTLLPKSRFFLAGLLGGTWAFADRAAGRANFLYSFRIFLVSAWKVLVKRGWVRSVRNGDVALFVLALAAINCVYDKDPGAVGGAAARRGLGSLRGRGFRDCLDERRTAVVAEGTGKGEVGGKVVGKEGEKKGVKKM